MSESLLLLALLLLGPLLLAEGLLARYELLAFSVGLRAPAWRLPAGVPYARGAAADAAPAAYLVYLDGIGKRRFTDTRDGGKLVSAIIAAAPQLRVLSQIQPYSPLARPLTGRPVWDWLRRRVGITLFLHNVMQTFVAADPRYRPLYNQAVGLQIAAHLRLAGYTPGSGVPIVLLGYSGGAQAATGALGALSEQFRAPLHVITLGGFHSGANDLSAARHLYCLTSAQDWIEKLGTRIYPHRWRLFRRSAWNRAVRAGKVSVQRLEPATHVGPQSYISPSAHLEDGRSHLCRTTETVIDIIRCICGGPAQATGDAAAQALHGRCRQTRLRRDAP